MTDEQEPENNFAEFEAKAAEPDKIDEVTEPVKAADPDDAPNDDDDVVITDKPDDEGEEGKTRSRPWSKRVDILTARNAEKDRRIAELEGQLGTRTEAPKAEDDPAPDPDAKNADGSDKYEFGEADPKFLRDNSAHAVREALREDRESRAKQTEEDVGKAEIVGKLHEGMATLEKAGTEKYDDFEAKIEAAVEARAGEPLHPMVSIGLAVSPAGADIAYRLATDEATSDRIEKLAKTNPQAAAIAFGELEGEFLTDDSDSDLNPADPLDLARMLGREKARRKGGVRSDANRITNAPKPADQRARGAGGKFEVDGSTTDFAAFERKANARR